MSARWPYLLLTWCMLIWFTGNQFHVFTPFSEDTVQCMVSEIPETDSEHGCDAEEKSLFIVPCEESLSAFTVPSARKCMISVPAHYVRPWPEIPTPPPGV